MEDPKEAKERYQAGGVTFRLHHTPGTLVDSMKRTLLITFISGSGYSGSIWSGLYGLGDR